jgi:hypothetical protein
MSAATTCLRRLAALVSASRLISMIPPSVANDLVGTNVKAQGIVA